MDIVLLMEYLKENGQLQLLNFYDELNSEQKEYLINQIKIVDFNMINNIESLKSANTQRKNLTPIKILELDTINKNKEIYNEIGLTAIRNGKVGVVLLAGGQGTRVGTAKPKGTLNIGISKVLYLFEILIDNVLSVVKQVETWIPFYIMTSNKTHDETVSFFEEHNYFGYNKSYVKFFMQDMMPSVDFCGKILLEDKYKLSFSPNGNGGWFFSLVKAGLLKDIKSRNVEWLNVFSVDNPLQQIADSCFIGAAISSKCNCAAKVVKKKHPNERVGVICLEKNKPSVIEYFELTEDMINSKDAEGNYQYNFGVILNYLFSVNKLKRMSDQNLPVHVVEKKIPFINSRGIQIEPKEPNGYKFETLILDLINIMDTCLPYEVCREKEFAPIKNSEGEDSLETAQKLMILNDIPI